MVAVWQLNGHHVGAHLIVICDIQRHSSLLTLPSGVRSQEEEPTGESLDRRGLPRWDAVDQLAAVLLEPGDRLSLTKGQAARIRQLWQQLPQADRDDLVGTIPGWDRPCPASRWVRPCAWPGAGSGAGRREWAAGRARAGGGTGTGAADGRWCLR